MAGDDQRTYALRAHDHGESYESAATAVSAASVTIGSVTIYTGTGTPEAAVTAVVGSLFLRDDGGASTTLYVKESGTGNTGWVAK